jgi:hypothetical protein
MRILLHTRKKGVYEGHPVSHDTYFLGPKMWKLDIDYIHLNACGMMSSDGKICTGTIGMRQQTTCFEP